jgi:hypothetical protein
MKRIFRLPVLAGVIVMAAMLASLTPTTSNHVYAQVTVYYPYGQGPYGGYVQGYATPYRANSNMFPSNDGRFDRRDYGYSGYGYVPSGNVYRYNYGPGPYVRYYGRTSYYQPSYAPVYVPFGYGGY